MDLETEQTAGTPEAVEALSPSGIEGSGTSPEAVVEARSSAEIARDEFLKKFGSADDDEARAPEADAVEATDAEKTPEGAPSTARSEGTEDPKLPRVPKEIFDAAHPTMREAVTRLREHNRQTQAQFEEANRRIQEYEPAYQAVQSLQQFARENNLASEAISESLSARGLFESGQFQQFIDAVSPFWERAHRALGKTISPEVQALVDSGAIDDTAARRLTQAEEAKALAEAAAARERERRQTQDQATARQQRMDAIVTAARNTEAALRTSDPDFALKEPAIRAQFAMLLKAGAFPKDAADADRMIREIHQHVLVTPQARPQPTQPRPSASTPPTRTAPPRTTLEAVENAFAGFGSR